MKSKFFIISTLLHIVIFIVFSKFYDSSLKKEKNYPNININLTISTPSNANKNLAVMTTENKSKKIKSKTPKKKKKNPKKQVVQKKAEIIRSKPKLVQSKKTKPKEIVKPTDTYYVKSNKNIEKNNSNIEMVQETPTNDTVLGDKENDKNLIKIQNGKYALKNQKISGINIIIQKEIPPTYPNLALKMGYKKETLVKVKFLVNKKGEIKDVKFYTHSKYGFESEVEKALKQWVFEPIVYQNEPMPIYLYKVFHFVSKS